MKNYPVLLEGLFLSFVFVILLTSTGLQGEPAGPIGQPSGTERPLLDNALLGPMEGVEEIVFTNRLTYDDSHWYANIGYYCDDETQMAYAGNGKEPDVGRLWKLNLKSQRVTRLVDEPGGSVRDPVVHYDGKTILFSFRRKGSPYYNLYEIQSDGSGLKQITSGPFDDYEPVYLPNDDIVFVSTRCKRWVNCWMTQVGILYRCDSQGGRIRPISSNIEHDNTPAVLPDGRLIYTRWEYVDRSQVGYHHLWTMNPDGTGQMVYYGNQQHGQLFIDTKPVPGSDWVVGIDSPGHGRKNHIGHVALYTSKYGPDDPSGIRRISSGKPVFVDPYAFSEDCFLTASGKTILLMDGKGRTEILFRSDQECHEPRPIVRRQREQQLPERIDVGRATGQLILTDVYAGRNLEGVARGDVKKLLILETLPKPVSFSGGADLLSWRGTFTLERILGTVPVEEDGSAWFELPADRPVFFVALDKKNQSIKRMQSFVSVRPGEVTSCVGCHENRPSAPPPRKSQALQALQRKPSSIQRFSGYPEVLDFNRDIQPILDTNCVSCHSFQSPAAGLSLEGDLGPVWSHSYFALFARLQVADGRNGFGNQPPRSIGSSASRLLQKIDGSHYGAQLTEREKLTVWLWIESAAPYAGTYAALRNEAEQSLAGNGTAVFHDRRELLSRRCGGCHDGQEVPTVPFSPPEYPDNRGLGRPISRYERTIIEDDPLARFSGHILVNLSRPEYSPLLLAPLSKAAGGWGSCGSVFKTSSDSDFQALLASLKWSQSAISSIPRFATPQWKPNRQYIREMKKFGILGPTFDLTQDSIDPYETDLKYFRSLWP